MFKAFRQLDEGNMKEQEDLKRQLAVLKVSLQLGGAFEWRELYLWVRVGSGVCARGVITHVQKVEWMDYDVHLYVHMYKYTPCMQVL